MALDGTSERRGSPSAKVQCSFKCRCGRPRWRRRSMDQKTRVTVKIQIKRGPWLLFRCSSVCSSIGDFAIPFFSRLSLAFFSTSSSWTMDSRHKMERGQSLQGDEQHESLFCPFS